MDSPRPPQGGEGGRRPGEGGANHTERSDADLLAVGHRPASPSFPHPLFIQRRCAPDGWKPSPGLRPPSPAKRGREGIHRKNSSLRKPFPHLVIARSAATWQSSAFHAERSDAVFLAVEGTGVSFLFPLFCSAALRASP
jgi:hypothetical protein